MKLNKKGFVSSAVLYSLLLLFLALILGLLALLSNRKQILDKLKGDIKSEINQTKNYKKYENGTAIYYNPVTGKICGDYIENNSKTGVTEGCLKWYIFNDDKNKATVNMILDHNTSGNVAWASLEDYIEAGGTEEEYGEKGNNSKGPLTAKKRLSEDTENWKEKTRLISTEEITKIIGNNSWDKNSLLYFETNSSSVPNPYKGIYAWLYDNTYQCTKYGCNISDDIKYEYGNTENKNYVYGYWTSSVANSGSSNSWDVDWNGRLASSNVSINSGYGVRPVITVSKKNIETVDIYDVYDNGEIVYYNPVTGKVCYDYVEANSKTGIKDGCLKWYIFNDNKNKSIVNMILDHNTTALVAYNSTGTNTEMKEAKTALENDTSNWKQKNTARLIRADEVAEITGANKALYWSSDKKNVSPPVVGTSISWFYLDGAQGTDTTWQSQVASTQGASKYAWLFDNTSECIGYGCNTADNNKYEYGTSGGTSYIRGYWTSTPMSDLSSNAWRVLGSGSLSSLGVADSSRDGIRPVISIYKDEIKYDTFEIAYNYTGSEQSFTVPVSGKYKIETWGAQGGTYDSTYFGGYGGYSNGIIYLSKNKKIYINVGQMGTYCKTTSSSVSCSVSSRYNGGGGCSSLTGYYSGYEFFACGSGGGATHMSIKSGILSSLSSNVSDVLIVSGGGGGFSLSNHPYNCGSGGSGGGIKGNDRIKICNDNNGASGGTNSAGAGFGIGETGWGSGGGSGLQGGYGSIGGAGGGAGYIGNSLLTDKAMYCYNCTESTDENTKTISTTNVSETPISKYAKIGNGYAKITYLGNE